MNQSLLHTPEGVRDIYGKEYVRKSRLEDTLKNVIDGYGYQFIETPTFEFFDVFSKEVGTIPSKELYKFFDKENNTLVLRPDFTPSVVRSCVKYFSDDTNPVRLSYLGNVFKRINSLQGKLSEETELGCELLGEESVFADAETIALAINCLLATGLKDFRVSVGHIEYFKGLCEEAGIDNATEMELRSLISGKNHFAARSLIEDKGIASPFREKLLEIADSFTDLDSLSKAKENVTNTRSITAISRLEKLYKVLDKYGVSKYVSFDLGMLSKYNYYTGVIFRVYTYGVGQPVVKGGRYDTLAKHFGTSKPAIGFCLQIDDILEAINSNKVDFDDSYEIKTVEYKADDEASYYEALMKANELRKTGANVALNPVK